MGITLFVMFLFNVQKYRILQAIEWICSHNSRAQSGKKWKLFLQRQSCKGSTAIPCHVRAIYFLLDAQRKITCCECKISI